MSDENKSASTAVVAETKKRKLSKLTIAVIVVCAALLLSMVGTALTRTSFLTVKEIRFRGTMAELNEMIVENNKATGREVKPLFTTTDKKAQFNMTTYIPKNATKDKPAPVVVATHGNQNISEMQNQNVIELTRRGFVVVVFDMESQGRSDTAIGDLTKVGSNETRGGLAAVQYAQSLPYVDVNKVGVTGHSGGNSAFAATINILNGKNDAGQDNSQYKIQAFYCPAGTWAGLTPETDKFHMLLGLVVPKSCEMDTSFFGAGKFLEGEDRFKPVLSFINAKSIIKKVYPAVMDEEKVDEGVYYCSDGQKRQAPEFGTAFDFDRNEVGATVIWNPAGMTHVMGTWSVPAAKYCIQFFYTAFGAPNGKVMSDSNQVWPIAVCFQLIGLLAFFASAIVFGMLLLKAPLFKSLNKGNTLLGQEQLPSIKAWKEIVPFVITFAALFFLFWLYPKVDARSSLLGSTTYPLSFLNTSALFNLVAGAITFGMILIGYWIKRALHVRDGETVVNPIGLLKVDGGIKQFFRTVLYVICLVAMMYVPVFIGYYVFNMTFSISAYTVGLPRLIWMPTIIRYMPFWLVFMLANAILNNLTRYKEIPEWASTLFCAVVNVLPIVIFIIIDYAYVATMGKMKYSIGDTASIFNFLAPMIFIAISGRIFYKKTGNSWAGALLNTIVVCMMATSYTAHSSSVMFGF